MIYVEFFGYLLLQLASATRWKVWWSVVRPVQRWWRGCWVVQQWEDFLWDR